MCAVLVPTSEMRPVTCVGPLPELTKLRSSNFTSIPLPGKGVMCGDDLKIG